MALADQGNCVLHYPAYLLCWYLLKEKVQPSVRKALATIVRMLGKLRPGATAHASLLMEHQPTMMGQPEDLKCAGLAQLNTLQEGDRRSSARLPGLRALSCLLGILQLDARR